MSYLSKERDNTVVHDLLCQHFLFVQVPNELDIAEGTAPRLHEIHCSFECCTSLHVIAATCQITADAGQRCPIPENPKCPT